MSFELLSVCASLTCGEDWEKNKDTQKSQKSVIFNVFGENPSEPICPKICMWGDVPDAIKFHNEILRGCNSTRGEISIFLLIFEWPLQQCSATVLPVIGAPSSWEQWNEGQLNLMTSPVFHNHFWVNVTHIHSPRSTRGRSPCHTWSLPVGKLQFPRDSTHWFLRAHVIVISTYKLCHISIINKWPK